MLQLIDPHVTLETDRLWLEPLVAAHAPALYPVLLDELIYRFIPTEPPTSVQTLAARYARLETRRSPAGDELWLNWALHLKAADAYIGRIEVTLQADRTAYLAYELSPAFWRQGLAAEACARVLTHLEQAYAVPRVVAEVDTRNTASIRLLERLGFARVAVHPAADAFKGTVSDEYVYERFV